MVSRHRISGVYIFFGILLAALAIFGCSGSGDDPLVTGPGNYGSISGTVQAPAGGSVRDVDASVVAAVNLDRAYVFLEKYPQIATYSNSSGKFTLSPVTFEQHNVIVKLTGSGSTIYKVRSYNVDLSSTQPAKDTGNLQVKLADRKVRIRINDGSSSSTIASATVTVWGETFTYVGNGEYESPVLPADETATITVDVAGRTEVQVPAQFVSTTPPVLETAVPPAGSTNMPPTVSLDATSLVVNNGATVTFTATAKDPENGAMTYLWESSSGGLSTATSGLQATWTAPSSGTGSATITFKATDAGGLFARTTLTIGYMPVANQRPVVDIVADSSTLTGGIAYALVASATDPDGNISAATYLWSVPSGSLSTTTQSITDWTTPTVTATTSVTVSLTVTDAAGDATTKTRTFSVVPAAASPAATISRPATGEIFVAGDVQFTGSVKLADNSVLPESYYHWHLTYPGGSTSEVASQTNNFSLSLSTPGDYTIWLTATSSEGLGCTKSVPFKINYPPQDLGISKSPNQVSFLASTAITLSASATDPENDTISYTWYDYSFIGNATSTIGMGQTITNYRDFVPGSHSITLAAADSRTAISSTSIVIEVASNYAPQGVGITVSPSQTSFTASAAVSLSGSATDPEGQDISYTWYDYSHIRNATNTLGTEQNITDYRDFTPGSHTITLTALDTFNASSSTSLVIGVATNTAPAPVITNPPSANKWYSLGETVSFGGYATDGETTGGYVATASLDWLITAPNATTDPHSATSAFSLSFETPGTYTIRLTATDELGIASYAQRSLYINATPTVAIGADPASGTRYSNGETFTLTADISDADNTESLSITWVDVNTLTQLGNATLSGPWPKTHTLNASLLLSDRHDIVAIVADTCGVMSVATKSLLINNLASPGMTINFTQYATAPGNLPILLASSSTAINLTAWANDDEDGAIPAARLACTFTGTDVAPTSFTGVSTIPSRYLNPGKYNLMVQATDSFGSINTATFSFIIWNVETYLQSGSGDSNLSNPSTILYADPSYYITDSGNSKLKKFASNFGLERAIGGAGTDPGSFTSLVGVTKSGGTVYTLEGWPMTTISRIQTWSGDPLATSTNFGGPGTAAFGNASYTAPVALTTNDQYLYLSDANADQIERLDMTTGTAYSVIGDPDGTPFSSPAGIRFLGSNIFVADSGNNRIVVCDTNLSFSRSWNASSPADITAYGDYYVTVNPSDHLIQIWDASGNLQANIGGNGTELGRFDTPISIVANTGAKKIVILENGNERVHVFTLPASNSPW